MNPLLAAGLHVVTRALNPGPSDPFSHLPHLPGAAPLSWVRRGEGMVGWGAALDIVTTGPGRFEEAAGVLRATRARAVVRDEVGLPGCGLVAFGSFTFADDSRHSSHLIVPTHVLGRRGHTWWLTSIHPADHSPSSCPREALPPARPYGPRPRAITQPGALTPTQWQRAVSDGVGRIERGDLDKVVLARDEFIGAQGPWDPRRVLADLAEHYEQCWTFAVAGLVGATPELLVRTSKGLVTSRVLAGTIRREGDERADLARAAALAHSSKDLEEHEYAVASVAGTLQRYCDSVAVPEVPYVLHLPNVMHLASDVTGVLPGQGASAGRTTSLELAGALHPSAAVCGTPREAAARAIRELEGMDRGRYAGPVGWMGADGDGEWGIALRCAQLSPDARRAHLYAGGGIVAGSVPSAELAETEAKFIPMRQTLS